MLRHEDQEFETKPGQSRETDLFVCFCFFKGRQADRAKSGSSPDFAFPAFCGYPTSYFLHKGGVDIKDLFNLTQSD